VTGTCMEPRDAWPGCSHGQVPALAIRRVVVARRLISAVKVVGLGAPRRYVERGTGWVSTYARWGAA